MKKESKRLSTVLTPCLQFVLIFSIMVFLISMAAQKMFRVDSNLLGEIIFWNIEYSFVLAIFMEVTETPRKLTTRMVLGIVFCYAVSLVLVWISSKYIVLDFWMVGVLCIALFMPASIAVLFQVILTVSYSMAGELTLREFVCYMTLGSLLIILLPYMKRVLSMIAVLVVALTTHLAFLILLDGFVLHMKMEYCYELGSTALLIVFVFVLNQIIELRTGQAKDCDGKLVGQLKEYSEVLFKHSQQIAELSKKAALRIGADERLCYQGGLYHEIGKIKGKNYIEEGLELLREAGVCQRVRDIVAQHNIHHELPTSREATIVMLSESIVSSMAFLKEKENKTMEQGKLVSLVFTRWFEQGVFKNSDITVSELLTLREFYQEQNNIDGI